MRAEAQVRTGARRRSRHRCRRRRRTRRPERRPRGRRPRRSPHRSPGATPAGATAAVAAATVAAPAAVTAAPGTPGGLGDGRGGVAQGRADLVDLELDDGALLALTGLEGPLLEPPLHDDAGPAGERLGDVLRGLTPDVAAQEEGLAVLPLAALAVEGARRRRHGEVGDGGTRRREPQLRVSSEVADHGDDGVAGHQAAPALPRRPAKAGSRRMTLVRSTDSLSASCRSISLTVAGSQLMSRTA